MRRLHSVRFAPRVAAAVVPITPFHTPVRMKDPIQLLEHKGQQIVYLDFTQCTEPSEGVERVARARSWFGRQAPDKSLRVCSDATGSRYDAKLLEALKELAQHNVPYVGVAAAVVPTAVHRVALNVASLFSKRRFTAFTDRQAALDWLAKQ